VTKYKLPRLVLSLSGTPPRIQLALESVFQLFPKTEEPADVLLEARAGNPDEIRGLLPDWLHARISAEDGEMEPVMVWGPQAQPGAVGVHLGLPFCAWASPGGERIDLVCGIQQEGPTIGIIVPVLVPLLREMFLSKGLFLFHSAAAICPNGVGLLLVAVSGGGKTTTALSLMRKGARLLGDDLVVIQSSENGVTAFGIPKLLNLREETVDLFAELKQLPGSAFDHTGVLRKTLAPQKVYGPDCLQGQGQMHVLYFLHLSTEGPCIRSLPLAEASQKLVLAQVFSRNQKIQAPSVLQVFEVLSRLRVYELCTGPDPRSLGDWLIRNSANHAGIGSPGD